MFCGFGMWERCLCSLDTQIKTKFKWQNENENKRKTVQIPGKGENVQQFCFLLHRKRLD